MRNLLLRVWARLGLVTVRDHEAVLAARQTRHEAQLLAVRAECAAQLQRARRDAVYWEEAWKRLTAQFERLDEYDLGLMRRLYADLSRDWEVLLADMTVEQWVWLLEAQTAARDRLEFIEHRTLLGDAERARTEAFRGHDLEAQFNALLWCADVAQSIPMRLRDRVTYSVALVDAGWWVRELRLLARVYLRQLLRDGDFLAARAILSDARLEDVGVCLRRIPRRYWNMVAERGPQAEMADFLGPVGWTTADAGYDRDLLLKEIARVFDVMNAEQPLHHEVLEARQDAGILRSWMFAYARANALSVLEEFGDVVRQLRLVQA